MVLFKIILILMILPYTCFASEKKYENVVWNKDWKKWQYIFYTNKKSSISRLFDNQDDAVISLNRLCDKYGVPHKNIEVNGIPVPIKEEKPHHIYLDKVSNKWKAILYVPGDKRDYGGRFKRVYGGRFKNIEDAKKSINQLCENHNVPEKFPGLGKITYVPEKNYTSRYVGVAWHKKSENWETVICVNGKNIHGGHFKNEIDAAKRINQMCDEYNLEHKNEGIGSDAPVKVKPKYEGILWIKSNNKYRVRIYKDKKPIVGGEFEDIEDAAKKVNELCIENDMPPKNPMVGLPNDETIKIEEENTNKNLIGKRKRKTDTSYLCNEIINADFEEKEQQKEITQENKLINKIQYF